MQNVNPDMEGIGEDTSFHLQNSILSGMQKFGPGQDVDQGNPLYNLSETTEAFYDRSTKESRCTIILYIQLKAPFN